jgi:hypothetical protein
MATKPAKKQAAPFNPRTARAPAAPGDLFIVAAGAPRHYITGHGVVGPGAIVALEPGTQPGDHLYPISAESAAKANEDENERGRFADAARRALGPVVARTLTRFAKNRAANLEQSRAASEVVDSDPAVLEAERKAREQADLEEANKAEADRLRKTQEKEAQAVAGKARKGNEVGPPGGDKIDPAGPGKSDATT